MTDAAIARRYGPKRHGNFRRCAIGLKENPIGPHIGRGGSDLTVCKDACGPIKFDTGAFEYLLLSMIGHVVSEIADREPGNEMIVRAGLFKRTLGFPVR